jgi:hypothetical protein
VVNVHLVVGVHYYAPLEFTHQGAPCRAGADFGTDFGAFDPERNAWREPLRDALIGDGNPLAS